jgi:hypothetical protein
MAWGIQAKVLAMAVERMEHSRGGKARDACSVAKRRAHGRTCR